jgi:hypothetical protein
MYALALHPDIQRRVIAEVDATWQRAGEQGRKQPTYQDDFASLEYTFGFMVSAAVLDLACDVEIRA